MALGSQLLARRHHPLHPQEHSPVAPDKLRGAVGPSSTIPAVVFRNRLCTNWSHLAIERLAPDPATSLPPETFRSSLWRLLIQSPVKGRQAGAR